MYARVSYYYKLSQKISKLDNFGMYLGCTLILTR